MSALPKKIQSIRKKHRREGVARTRTLLDRAMREYPGGARAFAAAIGVHETQVCRWRKGKVVPGPEYRQKMEDLLGIPAERWGWTASTAPAAFQVVETAAPAAAAAPAPVAAAVPESVAVAEE